MTNTTASLEERILELEEELADLRPIAASAREAYAFLAGRRPGFAPSYAYEILRAVFEPEKPRRKRPAARRARKPRLGG